LEESGMSESDSSQTTGGVKEQFDKQPDSSEGGPRGGVSILFSNALEPKQLEVMTTITTMLTMVMMLATNNGCDDYVDDDDNGDDNGPMGSANQPGSQARAMRPRGGSFGVANTSS